MCDDPVESRWLAPSPWPGHAALTRAWDDSQSRGRFIRRRLESLSPKRQVWCVLASGSLGRRESQPHSDADLLIVVQPGTTEEQAQLEWQTVWRVLEADGIRPPQPHGIYARCLFPEELWANTQGAVSPPVIPYGQRIQLLLDAQPLWEAADSTSLYTAAIDWFQAGSRPGEPWWDYLLDETQRYFRALRVANRGKPSQERPKRDLKFDHSRFLMWSAWVTLVGTASSAPLDVRHLLSQLADPPLLRLVRLAQATSFEPRPWLDAYDQFLEKLGQKTCEIVTIHDDPWGLQASFFQFLLNQAPAWHPGFLPRLLF